MKACAIAFSLLLSGAAVAADDAAHGKGDCDSYPWEMIREWSIMITDAVPYQALAGRAEEARFMPMDRRVQMQLLASDKVQLAASPEKTIEGVTYAGLAPMRVPFGKRYRISTSKPVWIDVIGPNGAVPASKFAMALDCKRLVKSVQFRMEIETEYWLQITGSQSEAVEVVITLDR